MERPTKHSSTNCPMKCLLSANSLSNSTTTAAPCNWTICRTSTSPASRLVTRTWTTGWRSSTSSNFLRKEKTCGASRTLSRVPLAATQSSSGCKPMATPSVRILWRNLKSFWKTEPLWNWLLRRWLESKMRRKIKIRRNSEDCWSDSRKRGPGTYLEVWPVSWNLAGYQEANYIAATSTFIFDGTYFIVT